MHICEVHCDILIHAYNIDSMVCDSHWGLAGMSWQEKEWNPFELLDPITSLLEVED